MLKLFSVSKYLTLELCSLKTIVNLKMVPKAKLDISRRSTIVIKQVFKNSPRITSYRVTKSHRQSGSAASEPESGHGYRMEAVC